MSILKWVWDFIWTWGTARNNFFLAGLLILQKIVLDILSTRGSIFSKKTRGVVRLVKYLITGF